MDMVASNPSVQGFANEERFFEIIERFRAGGNAPEWLEVCRRATRHEDSLGVDGFAEIVNVAGALISVPFQIKSSPEGITRLYQAYKVHWMDNLRCFIVSPEMPDRVIWRDFLQEMGHIRRHNEVFRRIEDYLLTAQSRN